MTSLQNRFPVSAAACPYQGGRNRLTRKTVERIRGLNKGKNNIFSGLNIEKADIFLAE